MWNSVSRAFSYGWSVGLSLIRKMSDRIFDTVKVVDEDASSIIYKVPNETDEKYKTSDIDKPNLEMSVHCDSLDETSPKINGGKKTYKGSENLGKSPPTKLDNRVRQKMSSDVRWNVGNGSNDCRWYNSDKLEKSLSDLSNSKWYSNAESSRSDNSYKGHMQALNSSESDIFPARSRLSNNPNEPIPPRPHPLFKSSSSSQLPSVRGNYMQTSRPWKHNGNISRPVPSISTISTPQSYGVYSLYSPNRTTCVCGEHYGKKSIRTESVMSLADDAETPEGLSWRRLHMSRAKLKATATTSELLSGFAMVAMVELQINKPTAVPEWLFVLFAVCTTILVSVHIFALMISTYLLPNIDAVSKLHVSSLVTESPHDRMKSFIELAWAFSTILGLFLFLVEIAILCWVKFWDYSFTAAMSATMIIMPVLVLFVAFAMHFYHSLVVIKCKTSVSNMQELENMKRQLDNVSPA